LKGTQLQNFTPVQAIPELKTVTLTAGSGEATVKESDTVTVNYTGALAKDGKIFESSLDSGSPATFGLSQVISGWTKGLPGMKVGETRRLLIPSSMAYGTQGNSTIPANSDLVFDVTLIKIGK
jgi:FKBP-type peptidyl-prolyl cis-trans isomerase